ncbi:MAG: 3-oxoacyl-ACP reductase family protein [Planctomycetota bacterium]|jgi:3-oxoacyl-[acyl-carrier protein] reductase
MADKKRIALVAGASGGIGSAIVRELASRGVRIFAGFCKNEDAASSLAGEVAGAGGEAETVLLDIRDSRTVAGTCGEIFETHGSLDILVNSAAVNRESAALGMEDEDWEEVIGTNLGGAFRLARSAAKYMVLGRWGRIINISSISAFHGGRGQINYAASKAGMEAMTRVLALELGRKGVLANCVSPGVIETEMSERIRNEYSKELLGAISVNRFGTPEEVAKVVAFLASDAAGYINGQVIRVDGGMTL